MMGLIVDGKGKLADKEVLETVDKEANDEAEYEEDEEDEMEDDNLEEDVDADEELDPIEFWRPIATQKALMSTVMATLMSFVCSNSRQSCFTIPSHFVILLHQSSSGANLSESHRSSFRLFLNRPIDKDCQRTGFVSISQRYALRPKLGAMRGTLDVCSEVQNKGVVPLDLLFADLVGGK
ncbi:hypothetical protein OROHE_005609 [Orobanche hederae]